METQKIEKEIKDCSENLKYSSSYLEDILLRCGNLAFHEAMRQTFGPDYYKDQDKQQ